MYWLDFKRFAVATLLVTACSDDGVPQDSGGTGSTSESSASQGSATSPATTDTSAVTGLPSSTDGETTGPSGGTDSADPTGGSSSATDVFTSGSTEGSSGSGDGSGTETGGGGGTCVTAKDCQIVNDCCNCAAIGVDEEPPKCEMMECLVPACDSRGLGDIGVECVFGSCELETISCNPLEINDACINPEPKCSDGELPSVVDGCWGACVPAEVCDVVPACDDCAEDEACLVFVTQQGPQYRCTPVGSACEDGVLSCACQPEVCVEPFDTCSDQDGEPAISCACINC